ncbi:hypothetical protein IFM89_035131 [Coptis chinensis]|uniref:40S ribosomal protein S7 n=1 Tax=Coptis chinensis TaxID=261450 RepID=A0A835M7T5_9MAGN|nr:hypothetical protein IFM89_035131 [Coptis chinensis]
MLEDVVYPTKIVGKRIKYQLDGSKIMKVFLDPKERNNTEYNLETFVRVYRKLSGKDVVFENIVEARDVADQKLLQLEDSSVSRKAKDKKKALVWTTSPSPSPFSSPSPSPSPFSSLSTFRCLISFNFLYMKVKCIFLQWKFVCNNLSYVSVLQGWYFVGL